ncbi:hypothetical protein PINS_up006780 [Pythium insidiosum]|nr:hypothetical protein PINS_up006780 [Pythium insidiosum]
MAMSDNEGLRKLLALAYAQALSCLAATSQEVETIGQHRGDAAQQTSMPRSPTDNTAHVQDADTHCNCYFDGEGRPVYCSIACEMESEGKVNDPANSEVPVDTDGQGEVDEPADVDEQADVDEPADVQLDIEADGEAAVVSANDSDDIDYCCCYFDGDGRPVYCSIACAMESGSDTTESDGDSEDQAVVDKQGEVDEQADVVDQEELDELVQADVVDETDVDELAHRALLDQRHRLAHRPRLAYRRRLGLRCHHQTPSYHFRTPSRTQ